MDFFLTLHEGDRDQAFKQISDRYGYLIATADLSAVDETAFVVLCQLHNGLITEDMVDAKRLLLGTLHDALGEQDEFRAEIADRKFPGDTPESRAAFQKDLNGERERLVKLIRLVEDLDNQACVALLTRIEEVYAGHGHDIRDRCLTVFRKMKKRDRL